MHDPGQLIDRLGGTAAVARLLGIRPPSVSEWREKGIPGERLLLLAVPIERSPGPPIRRWDLRPNDWHRIWPELIGADGAPPVPAPEPARTEAA